VIVATDVRTRFTDAAKVFAAQKGADATQIAELGTRLARLAERYEREFGVTVREIEGGGAAGGLAGGLAALGAQVRPGFDLVADELHLPEAVAAADLVVTGEGRLDATSLAGKATGSLAQMCIDHGVGVVVIAGRIENGLSTPFRAIDLTRTYGAQRARGETAACIEAALRSVLVADTP
jgi:glycerate kinase